LEDTLKAFMHLTGQAISDMKNATVKNTQAIARIEGQIEYLVAEVIRIEEEELQGQLMAGRHYMIDEDDYKNPHYEYVQTTSTLGSEGVFKEIVNKPSLKGPFGESCD
jgi:hypothetical protein